MKCVYWLNNLNIYSTIVEIKARKFDLQSINCCCIPQLLPFLKIKFNENMIDRDNILLAICKSFRESMCD